MAPPIWVDETGRRRRVRAWLAFLIHRLVGAPMPAIVRLGRDVGADATPADLRAALTHAAIA